MHDVVPPLSSGDAYLLSKLDDAANRSLQAQTRIEEHEKLCAERYGAILSEHKRLASRMNFVLIGIMLTCGFDLFGSSGAYRIFIRAFLALLR